LAINPFLTFIYCYIGYLPKVVNLFPGLIFFFSVAMIVLY